AYTNVCLNNRNGISAANSSSLIRKNIILPNNDPGSGIHITAFDLSYIPIIDSNYIHGFSDGIKVSFGSKPTITNNIIRYCGNGYVGSYSDTVKIFNNLIISENGSYGLNNSIVP